MGRLRVWPSRGDSTSLLYRPPRVLCCREVGSWGSCSGHSNLCRWLGNGPVSCHPVRPQSRGVTARFYHLPQAPCSELLRVPELQGSLQQPPLPWLTVSEGGSATAEQCCGQRWPAPPSPALSTDVPAGPLPPDWGARVCRQHCFLAKRASLKNPSMFWHVLAEP